MLKKVTINKFWKNSEKSKLFMDNLKKKEIRSVKILKKLFRRNCKKIREFRENYWFSEKSVEEIIMENH